MLNIKIELDALKVSSPSKEVTFPILEKFLDDMEKEVSGFFNLPQKSTWSQEFEALKPAFAQRIPQVDTFVQLGIGGSSLGAELLVRSLGNPKGPNFHFLDNIDADAIAQVLETINPKRTLFYVVSKSGNTLETSAQLMILLPWLENKIGRQTFKNHFVFCTDPKQGALRSLANDWSIPTFDFPETTGGRYSVLSPNGLFPALIAGVDVTALLKGASDARTQFLDKVVKGDTPDLVTLAYHLSQFYFHHQKNITVLMPYSQKLKLLNPWFVQLWAESLGKKEKGMTPVGAIGATDQHSILQLLRDGPQDKVIGFIEVQGFQNIFELKWTGPKLKAFDLLSGITLNQLMDAELNATRQALSNAKKPHFSMVIPKLNAHTLGQLIFQLETLTALTGYFLDIDPFDQPGVEEGKNITVDRIIAAKRNMS